MKAIGYFAVIASAGLLIGCAATLPPPELIQARQAYNHASTGQAAQLVPAELHKAKEALTLAEKSFLDDPKSFQTRDLAYVADRKAKLADALASAAVENAATAKAAKDLAKTQAEIANKAKSDLAVEQKARLDAEKRTAEVQAALVKLAAVKEEERGLVITLSGSVLFASNKSTLLPAAQNRLNQVADALMATKERNLVVEGHTDSQGSSSSNQVLSQRRADAVRSYIISRGYPADLIVAQGIGEDRPVANNANTEGRANNRRVEIVIAAPARTAAAE
jgi:outer membrane protein OmpA-like peptidoglycan-associated protein